MSVLNGIGIAIFPLAEFLSGQLFQVNIRYEVRFFSVGGLLDKIPVKRNIKSIIKQPFLESMDK